MPTLYIIAGPNGAGKTTFARRFLAGENAVLEFVNADSIAQGLSPYAPEQAAVAAGRLMLTKLRELFSQRQSFAFETTLSGRAYRILLAEMKTAGYRIELDFLWLPEPERSIDRVAERVVQGGHHIPEDVIRRRHAKGLCNLLRIYRPLLDQWTLHDNSQSPARSIAWEEDGDLTVLDLEEFAKITKIVSAEAFMSELPPAKGSRHEKVTRALRRASADAIERARIFGTTLIYTDKDGKTLEVDPNDLLRENPNLIRELMGNDDPPIGHWGPLPANQMAQRPTQD